MAKKTYSTGYFLMAITSLMIFSTLLAFTVVAYDEIVIDGPPVHAGTGPRQTCGNNQTSCGRSGICYDLTGLTYCVWGRIVVTECDRLIGYLPNNRTLFETCDGGSYPFRSVNSLGSVNQNNYTITAYKKDTTEIIGRSFIRGEGYISSLRTEADLEFDFLRSEFNFLMRNVTLSRLTETNKDFLIEKVQANAPGILAYKTLNVRLPEGFTYSSIRLRMGYGDTAVNEVNMTLYRCSDFDSASMSCNSEWEEVPFILDTVNKFAIAQVSSFSAYILGEPSATTTTVPGTTTTVPGTTTTVPASTTSTTVPTTCTAGYVNDYRCSGAIRQRRYVNTDCSDSWINEQTCTYGCASGSCLSSGSSGSPGGSSGSSGTATTVKKSTTTSSSSSSVGGTTGTGQASGGNESATTSEVTPGTNETESTVEGTEGARITGFFGMMVNYMPIIVPIAAMAGALIYQLTKRNDRPYGPYRSSSYGRSVSRGLAAQKASKKQQQHPTKTGKQNGKRKETELTLSL